jgi:hypothetical protein
MSIYVRCAFAHRALPFCPKLAWIGKTDSSERTEKFHPAKAGEFPYGTYQTFAMQIWLGA